MVNWNDPRTINDAVNAANQRDHGPDGAGLGLALAGGCVLGAIITIIAVVVLLTLVLS